MGCTHSKPYEDHDYYTARRYDGPRKHHVSAKEAKRAKRKAKKRREAYFVNFGAMGYVLDVLLSRASQADQSPIAGEVAARESISSSGDEDIAR